MKASVLEKASMARVGGGSKSGALEWAISFVGYACTHIATVSLGCGDASTGAVSRLAAAFSVNSLFSIV